MLAGLSSSCAVFEPTKRQRKVAYTAAVMGAVVGGVVVANSGIKEPEVWPIGLIGVMVGGAVSELAARVVMSMLHWGYPKKTENEAQGPQSP